MARLLHATCILLALALLPACGGGQDGHDHADHAGSFEEVSKAVCVLSPTTSSDLKPTGTITLTQTKDGLRVQANVTGLTPNAKHGFHIHQFGDLSKNDGTATGGHFDPHGVDHGLPKDDQHTTGGHAGDLGNLQADENGTASYDKTFTDITLTGKNAVLGRGIIVHLKEDDGGQPTGNAGDRIAQGVIGIANAAPAKDQ